MTKEQTWHWHEFPDSDRKAALVTSEYNPELNGPEESIICDFGVCDPYDASVGIEPTEEHKRLIAASPTLLARLQAIVQQAERLQIVGLGLDEAKADIALALPLQKPS